MYYCFRENVVEVDARRIIVNDANGDFQGNVWNLIALLQPNQFNNYHYTTIMHYFIKELERLVYSQQQQFGNEEVAIDYNENNFGSCMSTLTDAHCSRRIYFYWCLSK